MKTIKIIVVFVIGFVLMVGILSFFPKNSDISPAKVAEPFVQRTEVEELVVLRDALKPGSQEAHRQTYKTIAWTADERAKILKFFRKINLLAPGLLPRGASDGTIAVYRANLPTMAKAGPQLIVIGSNLFKYPDYSYRVLFHEMVHAADSYNRLSSSEAFRKIYEPKIQQAIALLELEGLTPSLAAALPLGDRKNRIEQLIRKETGLPSAYASRNLTECLAEIISYWLAPEYEHTPPPEAIELLTSFANDPALPNPVDVRFRQAQMMLRANQNKKALNELSAIIRQQPNFYQARSIRGYLHLNMKKYDLALQDLKQAGDLVPLLEADYGFYNDEWRRVRKLVDEQE